jgi:hypothetical protein
MAALAAKRGTGKPITTAVNAWRANGAIYDPRAVERVQEVMRHDLLTDHRSSSEGRIRPSMLGKECRRLHALSYAGFDKVGFSDKSLGFMESGTWGHYQWQAMLLSAWYQGFGGITDIEVPVVYEPWKLSGSMDGKQPDGSIFELKTSGYYKYYGGKYAVGMANATAPDLGNLEQVMGYMKAHDTEWASIVYLSRDNNLDFTEFRVPFDQAIFNAKDASMRQTIDYVERGELPPMLEGCRRVFIGDTIDGVSKAKKQDWESVFDNCDFHHVCPKAIL